MASRFLTRRRMLAASGATLAASGPLALAACGEDQTDEELTPDEEADAISRALAEIAGVVTAARHAGEAAPGTLAPSIERLSEDLQPPQRELTRRRDEISNPPHAALPAFNAPAESAVEALKLQIEHAISVSLEVVGELPVESRQPVHEAITVYAAALAAIRETLGEEIAPDAFVMGAPAAEAKA